MERPTKTIVTPVGNQQIVVKEWITGRENEYIGAPLFDMVEVNAPGGSPDIKAKNLSKQIEEGNHRAVSTVVVSIDGNNENILEKCLEMIHDDYEFILSEIEKITKKKDVSQKS